MTLMVIPYSEAYERYKKINDMRESYASRIAALPWWAFMRRAALRREIDYLETGLFAAGMLAAIDELVDAGVLIRIDEPNR